MLSSWSIGKKGQQNEKNGLLSAEGDGHQSDSPEDYEKALEALARVLRCLGRHAFDLEQRSEEEIEQDFERWAKHVLIGTPIQEEPSETDKASIRRDWGELTRFVNGHRQHEKHYVTRNLQDVRNVLWEFTSLVGRAVVEDQNTDQQIDGYLVQLRTATEGGSFTEVKQALMGVVEGINSLVLERKKRQQHRIQTLGEKLRSVEQELGSARRQMTLDPLTRLFNRGALDLQLERTVSVSFFSETPACLFMVDIDHFKQINDVHGHPAGDAVLKQLADRLVSTFPRKGDFIARYGGEEFCVLLPGASLDQAQRLAERLLDAVRSPDFEYQDTFIPVTVSVGVAELGQGERVSNWVERADRALYQAKDGGRNRACIAQDCLLEPASAEARKPGASVKM